MAIGGGGANNGVPTLQQFRHAIRGADDDRRVKVNQEGTRVSLANKFWSRVVPLGVRNREDARARQKFGEALRNEHGITGNRTVPMQNPVEPLKASFVREWVVTKQHPQVTLQLMAACQAALEQLDRPPQPTRERRQYFEHDPLSEPKLQQRVEHFLNLEGHDCVEALNDPQVEPFLQVALQQFGSTSHGQFFVAAEAALRSLPGEALDKMSNLIMDVADKGLKDSIFNQRLTKSFSQAGFTIAEVRRYPASFPANWLEEHKLDMTRLIRDAVEAIKPQLELSVRVGLGEYVRVMGGHDGTSGNEISDPEELQQAINEVMGGAAEDPQRRGDSVGRDSRGSDSDSDEGLVPRRGATGDSRVNRHG